MMKKEERKVPEKSKTTKKEIVQFLYKTKNIAKKECQIPYNLRTENYTNRNNTIYTYGIR